LKLIVIKDWFTISSLIQKKHCSSLGEVEKVPSQESLSWYI
jgi:hypothetical protein